MYLPLNREHSKWLGLSIMLLGFFLSTPPGFISPDDFLNVILAGFLVSWLHVSTLTALILTYTVIAWGLIILGAMIYPYNTKRLVEGKFHKLTRFGHRIVSSPKNVVLFAASFYILIKLCEWYMSYLGEKLII